MRAALLAAAVLALWLGACLAVPRTRECFLGDPDVDAARGMVASGELVGLLPTNIPERFGEPRTDRFGSDLHYHLGPSGGFCVDNTWLLVDLGEEGRVARATVMTD